MLDTLSGAALALQKSITRSVGELMGNETDGGVPLVAMAGISKSYGGAQACVEVDFAIRAGQVHALLGENGAGKSTLMKVLSGDITDYTGTIHIGGEPRRFARPADAQHAGIAMIHQELDLVPALSVAENVYLGREPRTRLGTADFGAMVDGTAALLERTGIPIDPRRAVEQLRTGEQQLVIIAKALALDARVLIMDEPTSALSSHEVEQLFGVVSELRAAGVGIVYISHRMDEIGRIADVATVLRNGSVVKEFDVGSMTSEQASEAMVGRKVEALFTHESVAREAELLEVGELRLSRKRPVPGRRDPRGISLRVHAGEIVGLAGLLGAGRTELLQTLYGVGAKGRLHGRILLNGKEYRPSGVRNAMASGIAYVPEDRRIEGLSLDHSVTANSVLSTLSTIAWNGFLRGGSERDAAARMVERLGVKTASVRTAVGALSGGNQQKVVLGRNLVTEPKLLLLDEPTRGVDIGAKAEIYTLLTEAAKQGLGVLLASSELAELIGVCDRVVVLRDGVSVREMSTARLGEAELLAVSMGAASLDESRGEDG